MWVVELKLAEDQKILQQLLGGIDGRSERERWMQQGSDLSPSFSSFRTNKITVSHTSFPFHLADEKMIPLLRHGVKAMSMGFLMDERQAAIWRGPMVQSALQTLIAQVRWAPLDCLIVDMPPGTGDAQLTVSQRLKLSGAIIISTPQDLALLDARRGVTMFQKVGVPILGLVENMSWFICSNCGHHSHIFGSGGVERTAEELGGLDVLGKIPLVTEIRASSDEGFPIVESQPESDAAQGYMNVARKVWEKLKALDTSSAG